MHDFRQRLFLATAKVNIIFYQTKIIAFKIEKLINKICLIALHCNQIYLKK